MNSRKHPVLCYTAEMVQLGSHIRPRTRDLILIVCAILLWSTTLFANASEHRTLSFAETTRIGPVINVEVNGIATTALLDTGATVALIDDDYLTEHEPPEFLDVQARILGLGGLREYPTTTLQHLTVGERSWQDVRVAVNSSHRFPVDHSILPISLFQTSIVDFEFSKSQVHLYDGRPRRVRNAPKSVIRYKEDQRLIFVPVKINGVRGLALIDTGAERSFVNPAYARRAKAVPEEYEQERMQGSDLSTKTAHLYTFRKFEIGEFGIARTKIPVLRTDLFEALGYTDTPMMVMGMDFLHHFRLQVDRKRKRITMVQVQERYPRSRLRPQAARISDYFDR